MRELIRRLWIPMLNGFLIGALLVFWFEKKGLFETKDWVNNVIAALHQAQWSGRDYFYYLLRRRQCFFLLLGIASVIPGGFFFTSVLVFCISMAYGGMLLSFVTGQGMPGVILFLRMMLPTILFGIPPFIFLSVQILSLSKRYEKGAAISNRMMGRQILFLMLILGSVVALSLLESVTGPIFVIKI